MRLLPLTRALCAPPLPTGERWKPKAPRAFDLTAYLRDWLAHAPKKRGDIKLKVDVDPQSFL